MIRRQLTALVAVALVMACGGEPPPEPGTINVNLASPASDDGGVLLTINGSITGAITPADTAYRVFERRITTTETRIAVVGNIRVGQPLLRIGVPNVNSINGYTAVVEQVSDRADNPRPDVSAYDVIFTNDFAGADARVSGITN